MFWVAMFLYFLTANYAAGIIYAGVKPQVRQGLSPEAQVARLSRCFWFYGIAGTVCLIFS
jgi:hypothetical protein